MITAKRLEELLLSDAVDKKLVITKALERKLRSNIKQIGEDKRSLQRVFQSYSHYQNEEAAEEAIIGPDINILLHH